MIKGIFQVESEFPGERGEIIQREVEFESVRELEQFISYYRQQIKGVKFEGEIKIEEEEE